MCMSSRAMSYKVPCAAWKLKPQFNFTISMSCFTFLRNLLLGWKGFYGHIFFWMSHDLALIRTVYLLVYSHKNTLISHCFPVIDTCQICPQEGNGSFSVINRYLFNSWKKTICGAIRPLPITSAKDNQQLNIYFRGRSSSIFWRICEIMFQEMYKLFRKGV